MKVLLIALVIAVISSAGMARPVLYNFRTQLYQGVPQNPTADKMRDFIPQHEAAQGLYTTLLKTGKTPTEAVIDVTQEVIKANIGTK